MTSVVPILLGSTGTHWYGTARAPRELAKAGFEVTLLTPRNSLAESSRFVTRVAYLVDKATPLDWIHAVAAPRARCRQCRSCRATTCRSGC